MRLNTNQKGLVIDFISKFILINRYISSEIIIHFSSHQEWNHSYHMPEFAVKTHMKQKKKPNGIFTTSYNFLHLPVSNEIKSWNSDLWKMKHGDRLSLRRKTIRDRNQVKSPVFSPFKKFCTEPYLTQTTWRLIRRIKISNFLLSKEQVKEIQSK